MLNLILFILICFGITQIVCYGKIFDSIRPHSGFFAEMLSCSMCTAFHIGYVVAFFTNFSGIIEWNLSMIDYLFLAFVSSGTSYVFDKVFGDEGININEIKKRTN